MLSICGYYIFTIRALFSDFYVHEKKIKLFHNSFSVDIEGVESNLLMEVIELRNNVTTMFLKLLFKKAIAYKYFIQVFSK